MRSRCLEYAWIRNTTTSPQLFYGPFPGPPRWAGARKLLDFMVQGKINGGRHTDHLDGRHSIRTSNQCPPPPSPHFLQAVCPSCRPTNSVKAPKNKKYVSIAEVWSLLSNVWCQAKVTPMPTYLIVIRLLMEYCCREPAWSPVSQWVCSSASLLLARHDIISHVLLFTFANVIISNGFFCTSEIFKKKFLII